MDDKVVQLRPQTEGEKLFRDLSKPSLHALSYALRHPDTWPKGFVWGYQHCDNCAMGLAHGLWNQIPATLPRNAASYMAREFAMPFEAANSIFMGKTNRGDANWLPVKVTHKTEGSLWWKKDVEVREPSHKHVTPEMVADQIDAYLATAE